MHMSCMASRLTPRQMPRCRNTPLLQHPTLLHKTHTADNMDQNQPAPNVAPPLTPLDIDGVVYTTVFNPYDGRKNWIDMLCTFCWAFRDIEDATLIQIGRAH